MEIETKQRIAISFSIKNPKLWLSIILGAMCAVLCVVSGVSKTSVGLVLAIIAIAPVHLVCAHKTAKLLESVWCLGSMPITLFCSQLLLNQKTLSLGIFNCILGCLVVAILIVLLYAISGKIKMAVACSMTLLMLLTTANYFVYTFRGSEFAPYDLLAIGTAAKVAGQYSYSVDAPFAYAWCIASLWISAGYCLRGGDTCLPTRKWRLYCLSAIPVLVLSFISGISTVEKLDYRNEGAIRNGYILNFVKKIDYSAVDIPDNYETALIEEMEQRYFSINTPQANGPDIIVVMNESFADLRIIGNLQTNIDVMPFFDSILGDSIHGYALASSIGGGTCNSEWQFLTNNNMGFVADGSYPYQQYIKTPTWSLISEMEQAGYSTIATHPEQPKNWMRETVYSLFGIDKCYFIDEYPQKKLIRSYVSDLEAYEKLIELYEASCEAGSNKVFLFDVTMQNHGGYSSTAYQGDVSLTGYSQKYPAVNQYLSLIRSSDAALAFLLSYFEQVERDTIIMFFGDHLPQFAGAFYEELHGGPFDTLEEQMLQYTVPFFVWANYDIEEQDVGLTSLNFLSNYVYEAAGLPLPPYNAFLKDVQEVIPAMNAFGYYSKEQGAFIPYEEAVGDEAEMLDLYRILQYNCLFDKENRSQVFFPTAP